MISTSPKMLRETLCRAQSDLSEPRDRARIGILINLIDEHRPLGSNGKHGHGELCTDTCGCEGSQNPWSITLPFEVLDA